MEPACRIRVRGTPFLWAAEKGSWHFLRVTGEAAGEVRLQSLGSRGGFGSVPVAATIAGVRWRTSLFPDSRGGGYLLPLKAEIRRRAAITLERDIEVELQLFP
jgi:hypothetical protein